MAAAVHASLVARGFVIRAATPDDAGPLAQFWRDRFVGTFGPLYPPEDLAAFLREAYAPARIAAEISDPAYRHHVARREAVEPKATGQKGVGREGVGREAGPSKRVGRDGRKRELPGHDGAGLRAAGGCVAAPEGNEREAAGFDAGLREGPIAGALKTGRVGLPLADQDAESLWEVHRLYLSPTAFGTGLADAFMGIAREEARSVGALGLVLGVYSDNKRAQRFYAKHGFERIGRYQFPVGRTLDEEWIMRAPV